MQVLLLPAYLGRLVVEEVIWNAHGVPTVFISSRNPTYEIFQEIKPLLESKGWATYFETEPEWK